ncbi:MAG: glycosyltransferase family 4 protein [Candidatus Bathyarchaeia archaeon]
MIGGVYNVAYYLPRILAKQVNLTYFPYFALKKDYASKIFRIYANFFNKRFDIVHFNLIPNWNNGSQILLRLAKRRQCATVLNIHGIITLERQLDPAQIPESVTQKTLETVIRACKTADVIVVNSKYMRNSLVSLYGVNQGKIEVIPNGVNLNMFSSCNSTVLLDGDPSLLFVGSLSNTKGLDILFEALTLLKSRMPKLKLHLIGMTYEGKLKTFQELVEEKGIADMVVFHGWMSHSRVTPYFKSADICIFPSRHEGFGIALLEAMAAGTPVVASNIAIFRDILQDGRNGTLFESENPVSLSDSICELYQSPEMGRRKAEAAQEAVKVYSWERVAENYISLYRRLLKEQK